MESHIIAFAPVLTALVFPYVIAFFCLPWRKHPALDATFIWQFLTMDAILAFLVYRETFEVPQNWILHIRAFLWTNMVVTDVLLVYLIYKERKSSLVFRKVRHAISRIPHPCRKRKPTRNGS